MGWERKRGKIEEFNRLLRGATDTTSPRDGRSEILPRIRYCITLDSDTRLPRDAARQLIGVIEHPLNRPRFDPELRRVVEGYGILQPRVSVTMASAAGSLFARAYAGHTGIDPYTTAVSDTYQDLFAKGIFTGKGLYDVDAFTAALEGRVAENAMLSHDLFEGLFARCALVSDIEVVDDFPFERARARAAPAPLGARRLADPVLPAPGDADAARVRAHPAAPDQPLEGPRQSAPQPARPGAHGAARLGLDVAAGAGRWPGPWRPWRCLAFPLIPPLRALRQRPAARSNRSACSCTTFGRSARRPARRSCSQIVLLPYHAFEMLHAIILSLVRMVHHAAPSARVGDRRQRPRRAPPGCSAAGPRVFIAEMWAGPVAALAPAVGWCRSGPPRAARRCRSWPRGSPRRWSRGGSAGRCSAALALGAREDADLRRIARRTWHYFERFTTAQDHWLPPDNVQEVPELRVARRTSPTNISMGLLSTLAAHDLGYIGTGDLADRIENTLTPSKALERHEGHLLNWYDTEEPRAARRRDTSQRWTAGISPACS